MTSAEIIQRIQQTFPDAEVTPEGEDCSYTLHVVSDAFVGQSLVKRHRMIQDLFRKELASGEIHALSIKPTTRTT